MLFGSVDNLLYLLLWYSCLLYTPTCLYIRTTKLGDKINISIIASWASCRWMGSVAFSFRAYKRRANMLGTRVQKLPSWDVKSTLKFSFSGTDGLFEKGTVMLFAGNTRRMSLMKGLTSLISAVHSIHPSIHTKHRYSKWISSGSVVAKMCRRTTPVLCIR